MKYIIAGIFAFCLAWAGPAIAQSSPKLAFNQAANLFIDGQNEQALRNVNNALKLYPDDPQLKALKEKLEQQQQEQEQQQQQQDQQEQENGEENQEQSEDQNGENQPQDSEDQQEGEEGEPSDEQQEQEGEGEESEGEEEQQSEEGDEGNEENEGKEMDPEQRLQEMNISPEKARMILEAMKSNEVQYLQQKKRQQTRRSDSNRPDW